MGDRKGTKVYVGNLNVDASERDLRDTFERYGHLTDVWVARKPPGMGICGIAGSAFCISPGFFSFSFRFLFD